MDSDWVSPAQTATTSTTGSVGDMPQHGGCTYGVLAPGWRDLASSHGGGGDVGKMICGQVGCGLLSAYDWLKDAGCVCPSNGIHCCKQKYEARRKEHRRILFGTSGHILINPRVLNNYRQVSNFYFLSKITEKVVLTQL